MPHPNADHDASVAQLQATIRDAIALSEDWLASLPSRSITAGATPDDLAPRLDEPLPETGIDPSNAVREWLERAEPGIVTSNGPRYFGFVTGGSLPAALGGDIVASTIDQNTGLWDLSPAAAQTEQIVIRWLKELFELPESWSGVMTSGATMSNLVGLGAARQWAGEQLGFDPATDGLGGQPPITVVSSEAIHVSARKALGNLGLGRQSVRTVPALGGRVDLDTLAITLARIDGPIIVVGNAGEVNTGQFDDLRGLASLCREYSGGAWLHVDAAFGLFAGASPRYRHLLDGIANADSVGADAHKWLNVPYDSGFAFVRDRDISRRAFASSGGAAYLEGSEAWNAEHLSPEMSRRARSIPAWCALRSLGRTGYRDMVERCIANATMLAQWADQQPWLELMNAEQMRSAPFSIVCLRFTDRAWDADDHDRRNSELLAALQSDGRVYASPTRWEGKASIRFAFDNWMTTIADVEMTMQVLEELHQGSRKPA